MSTLPQINVLPGQNFECTACGKCCNGTWNIAVDPESYRKIEASDAYQRKIREGYVPLTVAEDGKASVGRNQGGGCVFLGADNLCDIHGELGMESKPLVCRTYPHMVTRTPDGYFSSLSFACPAVLSNTGVPMEEKKDELAAMLETHKTAVPQNVPIEDKVRLWDEHGISWEEYLRLERHLMSAFNPQYPGLSMLAVAEELAGAVTAGTVETLIEEGFKGGPDPNSYGYQLLEMFGVNCVSIMELEKEPEARGMFMNSLMTSENTESPRFGCLLTPFSAMGIARARDLPLIRYYVENVVFGKRLTNESLLGGILTLAVGLALLVYYLEMLRGKLEEQEAVEKAYELIEGDVVTHSRGLNVLLDELPKALMSHLEACAAA